MVDIYCNGGSLLGCQLDFEELHHMMMDAYISDDTFIRFKFENGDQGAVRKRYINSYCESAGEEGDADESIR